MYSQNDEERFITEFFDGRTGRFLDIGAFDGVNLSNTRKLLELGWQGVLVEPMWTNFGVLVENCRQFGDRTTLIMAAVGEGGGKSVGHHFSRLWVDRHPDRKWSTTVNRELLQVGSIMQPDAMRTFVGRIAIDDLWYLGPFQFVSIDAEWEDFGILKSTRRKDWEQVELLCVEPRGIPERNDMKQWLLGLGFATAYETPENLLCRKA